ncbi:hypothetical protein [Spelaeicoccus albus]|uniref:Uncharacterized protein n=1 Tax=Spelaeicoccus albus TaxID=1280376 RepID=A0A7Z0D3F8_9MICO|nr:hypothetical protein [Spelaeicoccus albus]NYI68172.1 hypothetical protein [Spelaeicoccus albus]
MTTIIETPVPPTRHRHAGRIVERTTTVTREIYIDGAEASTGPGRFAVRAGIAIANWGRRRALRRAMHMPTGAAEIARRLDRRKDRDLAFFTGLPR